MSNPSPHCQSSTDCESKCSDRTAAVFSGREKRLMYVDQLKDILQDLEHADEKEKDLSRMDYGYESVELQKDLQKVKQTLNLILNSFGEWPPPRNPNHVINRPNIYGYEKTEAIATCRDKNCGNCDEGESTIMKEFNHELGVSRITTFSTYVLVEMDVPHFHPENIQLCIKDNILVIEGFCENHSENGGMLSRNFLRHYILPPNVTTDNATVRLCRGPNSFLTRIAACFIKKVSPVLC